MLDQLVLSIVLAASTPSTAPPKVPCRANGRTFQYQGQPAVSFTPTAAQLEGAPAWEPSAGDPPLSVSRAIEIATGWATAKYPRFDGMLVNSINLWPCSCLRGKTDWYYFIEFSPVMAGDELRGGGTNYMVGVLMNGTLVEGTTRSYGL